MPISLSGMSSFRGGSNNQPNVTGLVKPVRAVAFSPAGKLLAAAGDSKVIMLYDTMSGEQVANMSGHSAWIMSLAWSSTGEYLLSGCVDGPDTSLKCYANEAKRV